VERAAVAVVLGEAWLGNKRTRTRPIRETSDGYSFHLDGCWFIVRVAQQEGRTVVASEIEGGTITQNKLLIVIPFGKRSLLGESLYDAYLKDVCARLKAIDPATTLITALGSLGS
jgi:hypothetical protein